MSISKPGEPPARPSWFLDEIRRAPLSDLAASGLLAFVLAAWAVTGVAETPPSAADIAREKNEGRRVEDDFNARVAAIAGVPPARIEKLLPDDRRITVRSERFIEAIEARIRPLSEEERGNPAR